MPSYGCETGLHSTVPVLSIWFSTVPRLMAITCTVCVSYMALITPLKICTFSFVMNYGLWIMRKKVRGIFFICVISGNRITWTFTAPLSPPLSPRRKFTVSSLGAYIIRRHPFSHHSGWTTIQLVVLDAYHSYKTCHHSQDAAGTGHSDDQGRCRQVNIIYI